MCWRRRSVSRFRVEIKREINPDLAEQAVSQDEEYRLRSVPEQPNDEAYQRDDEYNQQSR